MLQQGAKLRKMIGFPFEKPPLKIGFPKLLQVFQNESGEYLLSILVTLSFTGYLVGNPCKKVAGLEIT